MLTLRRLTSHGRDVRRATGWTRPQARIAAEAMDVPTATLLSKSPLLSPADAIAWARAVPTLNGHALLTFVHQWVTVGVTDPAQRPAGMNAEDCRFLLAAGAPVLREWSPGARQRTCPTLVGIGCKQGQGPETSYRLATLLLGPRTALRRPTQRRVPGRRCLHSPANADAPEAWARFECGFESSRTTKATWALYGFDGLDWADLADCLDAGMSVAEAERYVRRGGDMDSVRLLRGLAG